MKAIHNLSIRSKFALILFPLVAGVIYLTYVVVLDNYKTSEDLGRLEITISLSSKISAVVHEMQRERGITAGHLNSGGEKFKQEVETRRKGTDKRLEEFNEAVQYALSSKWSEDLEPVIERQKSVFGEVSDIREKVDFLSVNADEELAFYTSINVRSISIIEKLSENTENKDLFQKTIAYVKFLFSKERAGLERGLMTGIFTLGSFDSPENYQKFNKLITEQEMFMSDFLSSAPEEWQFAFEKAINDDQLDKDAFRKSEEMRATALSQEEFAIDPLYWFNTMTSKIDLLKQTEDYLATALVSESKSIAENASENFLFLSIAVVLLSFLELIFLVAIIRNLLGNIGRLEAFSTSVSEGDFSNSIVLDSKDEIGKFSLVFTEMVSQIKTTQEELKKEKDNAEYLYDNVLKQSEVVFENVDQGIFLLDDRFNISNLYSTEMEKIFNEEKIAGVNFIQFMRPRLVSRDQDALELFVKHLFNSDIDESVVNQLNPIEQVQIFYTDDQGTLTSKHIRVSFSRVQAEDKIYNILVTVQDETERVMLQQEVEEAEGKNKQEMELMLSILKIEPVTLRDYLNTAKGTLAGISQKYENDDAKNFKELISFTYNTIHNLKANAGLIGLTVLAERFHEVENLLSKLQGKELLGDDFLKVLYEINEVNKIIENMGSLLERIINVSHTAVDVKPDNNNEKFTSALEKGTSKISEEMGKNVELEIENQDNITIPDSFKLDLKDVLLQLIRNSVVHGIESPEERELNNKPENSKIRVSVTGENDSLCIKYKDDGKGLDVNKIMSKAIENNLVAKEDVSNFSSKDVIKLLFTEGFSTVDDVTQHAGRGQGMSVIRSTIKKMDGQMKMSFKKGEYFQMMFTIPMNAVTESMEQVA